MRGRRGITSKRFSYEVTTYSPDPSLLTSFVLPVKWLTWLILLPVRNIPRLRITPYSACLPVLRSGLERGRKRGEREETSSGFDPSSLVIPTCSRGFTRHKVTCASRGNPFMIGLNPINTPSVTLKSRIMPLLCDQ